MMNNTGNDKILIDQLTAAFFGLFTNTGNTRPEWEKIREICLAEAMIIKKNGDSEEIYNLETFIQPRKKILSDGTLTEFEEYETKEQTNITTNIAQRYSVYEKKGNLNGSYFEGKGNKFFQFVKTVQGWKISSVIWEDD
jgi:hypothetical protein